MVPCFLFKLNSCCSQNLKEIQANVKYGYIKKYIVEPILKRFGVPDAYWRYYIAYYIDGTMAIIKEWLETDCQDSVEMIAAVIEECVRPADGTQGRVYSEIHKQPADKAAPKNLE